MLMLALHLASSLLPPAGAKSRARIQDRHRAGGCTSTTHLPFAALKSEHADERMLTRESLRTGPSWQGRCTVHPGVKQEQHRDVLVRVGVESVDGAAWGVSGKDRRERDARTSGVIRTNSRGNRIVVHAPVECLLATKNVGGRIMTSSYASSPLSPLALHPIGHHASGFAHSTYGQTHQVRVGYGRSWEKFDAHGSFAWPTAQGWTWVPLEFPQQFGWFLQRDRATESRSSD
ncbi:hypothetical protein DFH07DRAFT_771615 [Mycena maculata]|uniref:Secreted protein n=1 Tax=Mycena maculata TaxID=230809 RepID=A0AAD7JAM1_9AGAR|nr:hypothetical protein DFH07DRAFT_771615 [Mycena maculata]